MKTAFIWLRIVVLLKHCVKALESIAESQRLIAETVVAPTRKPKRAKLTEVFTPSVEEQNREWQRQQDAELYGEEISE